MVSVPPGGGGNRHLVTATPPPGGGGEPLSLGAGWTWEASNGQVWTRHLAPAVPAFHGLHCLLSSLRVRLAIRLFTGSQFPYLSLPRSGKVMSLVVLGFVAGSHWAIGLRLGRGFYLWCMLACIELDMGGGVMWQG